MVDKVEMGQSVPPPLRLRPTSVRYLIFAFALMRSEGQAYELRHKAMLYRISGTALVIRFMRHRLEQANRNGALLVA